MSNETNDLEWFLNKINKRIYRKKNIFECAFCLDVFKNGLIIKDKLHAEYIYECQIELGLIYYETNETK